MKNKLVAVYQGRFQPIHIGHVAVYREVAKKFGSGNAYVGTSGKVDPDKSPLTFDQKKKIWMKHGVPSKNILKTARNYNAEEISSQLGIDVSKFVFVVAVGEKDASRLKSGKYFEQYKNQSVDTLNTADKNGYYWVIPNISVGGKVLSATDIRALLRKPKLSPGDVKSLVKMTGLQAKDISTIKKLFEFQMRRKWWPILVEGGAAGHMLHPFEDLTMSFSELKKIITLAFQGKLQLASEGPITEKVDGQNLFASVVGGKVKFARNKGQLKNRGANAMTTLDISSKWKDVPQVRAAFIKAAQTLEAGLGKLPTATQKAIFKDGQNWVHFELIAHENPNVINYDSDVIIFHGINMVDDSGVSTGAAKSETQKLFKIFADAERSAQLKMRIQPPQIVKADKNITVDFSSDLGQFISGIDKIAKQYKLSDSSNLGDILRVYWTGELEKLSSKHAMDLGKKQVTKLVDRFAFGDKSYKITDWPKDIPDAAFIDDLRKLDSDAIAANKKVLLPLEIIVLKFGTVLLQNIDSFLAASPEQSVQQLRGAIAAQIANIRKSKDVASIDQMMGILQKIDSLGGFSALVPSEGLVFRYNGKLYKLTGLFAPVNQLMGIGRFSR